MSRIELTKKDVDMKKILKDIGYAYCIICRDIVPQSTMQPTSSHCSKCHESINPTVDNFVAKSNKPTIEVSYSMETQRFIISVVEADTSMLVYDGYIDDLWCHLGMILHKMGIDINEQE
tara:strand:+ start:99 stop:455 length:357 start_codon:yes stop_codon:yes gene_type:complete